ncbi:WD40-repeat-containing domain [Pseudocohnilembus persalinus]|uniref:WD40-repeat-containing domain n=1 Tax=Pseudocohnilembus persalinus TaxID=266149 RepID=A0A0V0QTT2_PSEPJ|nr:WD40-repeat-containing domain [Pseudocohnilembus persalinus]|eukprot:KRX05336.1 WD40-repeat-containing domain [Pseudocohnilembus persalinus]
MEAKFFIQKLQYLELLLDKQNDKALFLLRKELQKTSNKSQLYDLSILLAYPDNQQKIYEIFGTQNLTDARKQVIKQFISKFNPKNTLQSDFMEEHQCQIDQLPDVCIQVLKNQTYIHSEVWISKFSNTGKKLATVSTRIQGQTAFEKNTLTIWDFDLQNYKLKYKYHISKLHDREINYLAWNKNDSKLLTCSLDCTIQLINGEKDEIYKVLKGHEGIVQCAIFHPTNNKIYSAGVDNYIIIWNQIGIEESRIQSNRIKELVFTNDGKFLITLGLALPVINIINTENKQIVKTINEKFPLMCMSLSQDNKHLLVSTTQKKSQINLWEIETCQLINTYQGHTQTQFQIMSCIGGPNNDYITSGSEDGHFYIWNKFNNQKITKIQAHNKPINDITFNPINPAILATASDDGTVKIWIPKEVAKIKNINIIEQHLPKLEILEYEEDIESNESSSSQVRILPQIQQMQIEEEEVDEEDIDDDEDDEDEEMEGYSQISAQQSHLEEEEEQEEEEENEEDLEHQQEHEGEEEENDNDEGEQEAEEQLEETQSIESVEQQQHQHEN